MNTPIVAYTDDQLRAAWAACRLRTWPQTFEATMADPTRARLVRLHAGHQARCAAKPTQGAPTAAPNRSPAPFIPSYPPGYVDHKRAAAGDRD